MRWGEEEKFRCWVKAAVGQKLGSPKTFQNPSEVKGSLKLKAETSSHLVIHYNDMQLVWVWQKPGKAAQDLRSPSPLSEAEQEGPIHLPSVP